MEESQEYMISGKDIKKETEFELAYIIEWIFKNAVNEMKKENKKRVCFDQYWNLFALPNGSIWNLEYIQERLMSGEYEIKVEIKEEN